MLDDVVLVQAGPARDALARVLGMPPALEGLGAVEVDRGAHLLLYGCARAFQNRLLGLEGLGLGLCGLSRRDGLTYRKRESLLTSD